MEKKHIDNILADYNKGAMNKYQAMDALDIESVYEFMQLLADSDIQMETKAASFQSDSAAMPLASYFTEE